MLFTLTFITQKLTKFSFKKDKSVGKGKNIKLVSIYIPFLYLLRI